MKKVAVIGAGIIGICCALEIRKKGFDVILVDKEEPGSQASFGNAGVINNAGIAPYADKRIIYRLARYGLNRDPRFHFHWPHFFRLLPWLIRFAANCNGKSYRHGLSSLGYLLQDAVALHRSLLKQCDAEEILRDTGWLWLNRTLNSHDGTQTDRNNFDRHGVKYKIVSGDEIRQLEPHLKYPYPGGIWLTDTAWATHPQKLCLTYLHSFRSLGGTFKIDAVKRLRRHHGRWAVRCERENLSADHVVVASGAHSNTLIKPLGISVPMAMERGYHLAYRVQDGKNLSRSILDKDKGLVMTPMDFGIRVTSAVDLVAEDTTPYPAQIMKLVPEIESIFPLGERISKAPWMGRRPSMPDSMPVIGPAGNHDNLWLAFGHGHLGLTLGPKTGILIANQMAGKKNHEQAKALLPSRFQ